MRVALHLHQLRNRHRAVLRDATHVVAPQVHQHAVLGQLLLVGQELLLQRAILRAVAAPRARPGDGPHRDDAVLQPDQHLRRGPDDAEVPEFQVEQVGGGVDGADGAVELKRVLAERRGQALAEHDLEGVASHDVLLDAPDGLHEGGPREVGRKGRLGPGRSHQFERRRIRARAQPPDRPRQLGDRLVVAFPQRCPGRIAARLDRGDGLRPAMEVVHGDHHVGEHEDRLRQTPVVRRPRPQALDAADQVVPEVPDGAAPEARQAGIGARRGPLQARLEVGERVGDGDGAPPAAGPPQRRPVPPEEPHFARTASQEAVACPLFTTDHRLQQEAEGPLPELVVGRDGRVRVEEELAPDGDPPTRRGVSEQRIEGGFGVQVKSAADGRGGPEGLRAGNRRFWPMDLTSQWT